MNQLVVCSLLFKGETKCSIFKYLSLKLFLKMLDIIVSSDTKGVLRSLVYTFSVHDLKASLSVWRERGKEYSWIQEKGQIIYAPTNFFLSFNGLKKWFVFPLQRINTIALQGEKELSALGKAFPNFQPLKSLGLLTPQPLRSACLLHMPSEYATEPIHSITLSKHTQASQLPQTAREGARGGGWPAHQAPSSPALPSLCKYKEEGEWERERKWPVQGLIERNAKPFVGQASHTLLEFLNIKEKNNLCETPSPAATTGITVSIHHQRVPVFPTYSAITERQHTSYMTNFSQSPMLLKPPAFFLPSLPSLIIEEAKLHFFSVKLFHHLPLTQIKMHKHFTPKPIHTMMKKNIQFSNMHC